MYFFSRDLNVLRWIGTSLAALALVGPLLGAVQPADLPEGWSARTSPPDSTLVKLSNEQLVDLLQNAEPRIGSNVEFPSTLWPEASASNLGAGSAGVPVISPAAVELLRRGVQAIPTLLEHLSDSRPTALVYVVPKTKLVFKDEYDPRVPGARPASPDVNTGRQIPLDVDGVHRFKIGDVCYATLGKIVNRDLRAVRCRDENTTIFSGNFSPNKGDWFITLNSPVTTPALASAARADWSDVTPQEHHDSLRRDIRRQRNKEDMDMRPLLLLLYYYSSAGVEEAEALLRRKLVEANQGAGKLPMEEGSVSFWRQARFVEALAPFRSARLNQAILDLFRQATAMAVADLWSQPPKTWDPSVPSLGSDLTLQCAKQLIHQGYDDELKTVLTARLAAIEATMKKGGPRAHYEFSDPRFVNQFQSEDCRAFLVELEGKTAPGVVAQAAASAPTGAPRIRLGPVSLARHGSSLSVSIEPLEPSIDHIFVGRLIIDKAKDDVGAYLYSYGAGPLSRVAVGRMSDDELKGMPKAELVATLTRPAPGAKALVLLEGRVEMVVPDLDPESVVVVKDIATKFDLPLVEKALLVANISLTIQSPKTSGAGAGNIALSISDPEERFLNVEFRDASGHSLYYNHNGYSHSSDAKFRIDVYRLGERIPPETQMVIWLKTKKSFVVLPLQASNVPIPPEIGAGPPR